MWEFIACKPPAENKNRAEACLIEAFPRKGDLVRKEESATLISKGPLLERMEQFAGNSANLSEDLFKRLHSNNPLVQIGKDFALGLAPKEEAHLQKDWFDPQTGWWSVLQPIEPVLRWGLIVALEKAREKSKLLPIEFFWNRRGKRFEVEVEWDESQVTVTICTPDMPSDSKPNPEMETSALTNPHAEMIADEPLVVVKRVSGNVNSSPNVQILQVERDEQGIIESVIVAERLKTEP